MGILPRHHRPQDCVGVNKGVNKRKERVKTIQMIGYRPLVNAINMPIIYGQSHCDSRRMVGNRQCDSRRMVNSTSTKHGKIEFFAKYLLNNKNSY